MGEMIETYDYIIVGAGSAGCVLAERLSADRSCDVLLVEAGGGNDSVFIDMPAALSIPMNRRRYNWGYVSEPEPGMDGRVLHCPRGRGLGGSSAINGMVYVRGHARDFDRWHDMGAAGWRWQDVLPWFERAESRLMPAHGLQNNPLYGAFLDAGRQAGFDVLGDLNTPPQEGLGPLAMTVHGGKRWSARRAYLDRAMQRHNLCVRRGVLAASLRFEGKRAAGVVLTSGQLVRARREVLVCAGAIGSPGLLERSGVGDGTRLAALGIPLVHHLPGVGENLMDHLEVYVQRSCTQPVSLHSWLNLFGKAWIGGRWLLRRDGLGATNHFETGGFVRSGPQAQWPDVQFHFLPAAMHYDGSRVAAEHGFQIHTGPMLPESRGSVHITSRQAAVAPRIVFNYLSDARDREVFRASVRIARRLFSQPAFDTYRGAELAPGAEVATDDALDAWIRANAESAYHPCGTCRMGSDDGAVVDAEGRVRGLEALRVVDASIFPCVTNGNLNAPTIMAAEKIAAHVVGC